MFSNKSPKSIPDLKLWWDASDPSTVNDGWVLQNQPVYKFVDKISGYVLSNFNGSNGPSYSYFSVNGKNAIHFPYHTNTNGSLKALTTNSIDVDVDFINKTIFFVFKPTTTLYGNNTRYALSIWAYGLAGGPTIEPNFSIRSGSGSNPYTEYCEAPSELVRDLFFRNEKSYQYGLKTSTNPDANALQIMVVKTGQSGIKQRLTKFINLQENGFDSKFDFYQNDSIKYDPGYQIYPPTAPLRLTIGSYYDETLNKFTNGYPLEGYFCEMMYYNRFLEDDEMNTIASHLLRKWDPIRATFSLSSIPTGTPPRISIVIPTVDSGTLATPTINSVFISNNNVVSNGNGIVSVSGVCWSTSQNPTVSDSKTTDGSVIGIFNATVTGLNANTTYYVRAYATNQAGTGYGSQLTFTTLSASSPTITNFNYRSPFELTIPGLPAIVISTSQNGTNLNDCQIELGFDVTNIQVGGIQSIGIWRDEDPNFTNPLLTTSSNFQFNLDSLQKIFTTTLGRFGQLVTPQSVTPRRWYYRAFISTEASPTSTVASYNLSMKSSNTLSFVFEKTWMASFNAVTWNTSTNTFTLVGNWNFSSGLVRDYGFGWLPGNNINIQQSTSVNLITIGTSNTQDGSFVHSLNPGSQISVGQFISVRSWVEGDNGVKIWSQSTRSAQRTT